MKNDSLKKWALVAEIVGGVAIVLSLVFVGFQIQQGSEQTELNTRAIEVSAYQDLISQMNIMYLELLGDEELSEIVFDFLASDIEPDEFQVRQIILYSGYVFRHSEMAFLQYDKGIISEEQLFAVTGPLRDILSTDFGYERWKRNDLSKAFVEYVEAQKMAEWPQAF